MKSVAKKDAAVSPVIGTILLVAITVVLVAIVAAVVMGMVGGMGNTKTVGATASSLDGFVIGTVTGGQDAGKLTYVTISVTGADAAQNGSRNVSAVVGSPIKVAKGDSSSTATTSAGTDKFAQGQYQVVMTGKFSDNTSQVIYTGTVTV